MTRLDDPSRNDRLFQEVVGVLQETVLKLDTGFSGDLTAETKILGDLYLESLSLVEFCATLSKHFEKKFPFRALVFRDGKFQDFTLAELVVFLDEHLTA